MRVAWMIPAVLVTVSSGVALAQGPAIPGGSLGGGERPRHERFRPEKSVVDKQAEKHVVLRSERIRARAEIEGGGAATSAAARGAFQKAAAPGTKAAPLQGAMGKFRARGEVDRVSGKQGQATGQRREEQQPQAGSFKVSDKLVAAMNNRIRCAEGSDNCGTVARQAPIQAPTATGGSATLMKGAEPIANLRDRASKARESIMGKMGRMALVCAIAQTDACLKLGGRSGGAAIVLRRAR